MKEEVLEKQTNHIFLLISYTLLSYHLLLIFSIQASFGAHCTNSNEDRPTLSATEM